MADPYKAMPYASELFGIYKPLLGWKGTNAQRRVDVAVEANIGLELTRRTNDAAKIKAGAEPIPPNVPYGGVPTVSMRRPDIVRRVINEGAGLMAGPSHPLGTTEWMEAIDHVFADPSSEPTGGSPLAPALVSDDPAAGGVYAMVSIDTATPAHKIIEKEFLREIATEAPDVLNRLLMKAPAAPSAALIDPLANFDSAVTQALLSPIGILNLYRQLFYDLGTFLGPPVGHTWVSPGATVEIYEVHTRRSVIERETTTSMESIARSEREVTLEDELSTSVKQEDGQNLQIGASATASGGFPGVFQASASANMSLEQNSKRSRDEAHREKRTQTERLSNELRRSFRTTLKTTLEAEDTASRRHVLQNNTHSLINYELRRKMRKTGIAVQHVGTRLCWQMFIDDPGLELDVGKFVHAVAKQDETLVGPSPPPPGSTTAIPATAGTGEQQQKLVIRFKFEALDNEALNDGRDEDYVVDPEKRTEGMDIHEGGRGRIRFRQSFPILPPLGFRLKEAVIESTTPAGVTHEPAQVGVDQKSVIIQLTSANFEDAHEIIFALGAVFEPFPITPAASDPETARLREEEARLAEARAAREREAEITALRERIKLERSAPTRPVADLREEERVAVYRRIIEKLRLPTLVTDSHLGVELIRTVFEVDRLLFFVAQDWWRPRQHRRTTGTDYIIIEDAEPARMGSSLGWYLQADGDARRNAFLNTPWIKTVLPIRPGMERAAIEWLTSASVEGSAGLDEPYGGPEPALQGLNLREAILSLASEVSSEGPGFGPPTETVYETGFDPLAGGITIDAAPFAVFDRWVEVLPTDQVVAVEYNSEA
jgi:hypothetical protein